MLHPVQAPEQRRWSESLKEAPCPEYHSWLKLFYSGGFLPHNPVTMGLLGDSEVDAIFDIVWVHKSVNLDNF